jgi:hypothetical protein
MLSWIEDTPEHADTCDVVHGTRRRHGHRIVGPERTSRPHGRHEASAGDWAVLPPPFSPTPHAPCVHPRCVVRPLASPPYSAAHAAMPLPMPRHASALDVMRTDLPWFAYKWELELVPRVMPSVP